MIPYLLAWNFILELYFWLALLLLLIPTFIVATSNPYGRIGRAISRLSPHRDVNEEEAPESESLLARVRLSFGELITSSKSKDYWESMETISQLKAKIAKFKGKGVNTEELEKILEKAENEMKIGKDIEVEIVYNKASIEKVRSAVITPLLYLIAFLAYYRLSKGFVQESLLNLTIGRIDKLQDFPFHILDGAVDPATKYVTTAISIAIFYGIYSLGKGNLTPKQYDFRIQALTVVAVLPFITYFILHIMWLKENDSSWYFDLIFMEEMAGFTLSNEWPFETVLQDSRWQFYRVGLYNAIRVVLLSIVGCTFLGIFIGVSRLSRNRMLAGLAESYVEFFRNMPLVVQLFFLYTVVLGANLPPFSEIRDSSFLDWIFISNRGIVGPEAGIENMSLFLLAIGVLLGARIYIRFSERVLKGNPTVPILVDTLFSASILIVVYGIFNIVEWNYTVKPQASDGGLIFRFLLSLIQGIPTHEPLSMFILGIILLVGSALITFRLDEAGMNVFTVDDSSEGLRNRSILWAAVIITMIFLFYQSIWTMQPNLITEKEVMVDGELVTQELGWGLWKFEDGTSQSISSVFLSLWIGLTLYTTAQVAEIVRGSIQSLPRGQVEAAISLGLSPYQRLRLVILPQALRSMIPSMTNQYLNCWKNSSLAFVVGFSDFYAVFTTIVNNAGQAVPVFLMILLTYQAGSLTISAIMNYLNSSVTKVKI